MALGSVRVQGTLFGLGQAVGTASALAHRFGLSPREYGKMKISELQQQLLKDDQYIPGFVNTDERDFARAAKVTATSTATGTCPENVIDGIARQVGDCVHGWVSDAAVKLPQTIQLDFPREVEASQVRLTFDSDLTPKRAPRYSPRLVRGYIVKGLVDGQWTTLVTENDNFLRHRVHDFSRRRLKAIRVMVTKTWGDATAKIFEVRAY